MEVKVMEGNMPIEEMVDTSLLFADLLLPEQLQQSKDRCDRCQAQALHAFAVAGREGEHVVLMFCNHDAREFHNAGYPYLVHQDYRKPYDEWLADTEAERQAALKELAKNKTDDANLAAGTSVPLHLAQWDRQEPTRWWAER